MKNFLFIIHLFLTFSAFAQIPTQGLIGYWPFNGNSLDESGNNHDAIKGGKYNANYATDRFGKENFAYSADTTYLKIPYSPAFDFKTGDKFSISLWVYYPYDFGFFGEVFTKGMPGYVNYPQLGTYGLSFTDSPEYIIQPSGIFGKLKFIKDNWYHLVYVYDGKSILTYFNGTLDLNIEANITQSNNDMTIGRMSNFKKGGKIDDIAMYNRALTTAEIYKLYSATPTAINEVEVNTNLIEITQDNVGNYVIQTNAEIENIKVYNINGSLVKETNNKNIGSLSTGFYIFHVTTNQGMRRLKYVVK